MIVVDASVLVAAVAEPGRRGSAAQRRLDAAEFVAPELVDVEVMHALRRLVLADKLPVSGAEAMLEAVAGHPFDRIPHRGLLPRAWQLRENVTPYDAVYVALAEILDAPLVTTDARLAGAPGVRCAVEVIG